MYRSINCIYFKQNGGCSCSNVKRSFFGFGPRNCKPWIDNHNDCDYMVIKTKPNIPPPAQIVNRVAPRPIQSTTPQSIQTTTSHQTCNCNDNMLIMMAALNSQQASHHNSIESTETNHKHHHHDSIQSHDTHSTHDSHHSSHDSSYSSHDSSSSYDSGSCDCGSSSGGCD